MERIVTEARPTYEVRRSQLERICARFRFLNRVDVGASVLGRRIDAVRIGEADDAVLFAGGFHGQEWLTVALLLTFTERLCNALERGEQISGIDCCRAMLGRGIFILPCANPDGVEIALSGTASAGELAMQVERICGGSTDVSDWNANARGVDINHNFDAGWHILRQLEQEDGIDAPSPRRFGGTHPESEPETQALVRLCERFQFRSVYAFHSQGEEIYWHYGEQTPAKSALMARVLSVSSGYSLAEPSGTASHGGFKDWFIERFNRPGFTIEIGRGNNPLPISELESIYQQLEEMLMLAVLM